jgi:exosome complex component RRP40
VSKIDGSQPAVLDSVEFNGATKRNRPNLKVGDLIYAKVASVNKFTAPVLTCKSKTCKKDWTSGESTFGELKHGLSIPLHPTQCDRLKQDKAIFEMLKKHVSFEVAYWIELPVTI